MSAESRVPPLRDERMVAKCSKVCFSIGLIAQDLTWLNLACLPVFLQHLFWAAFENLVVDCKEVDQGVVLVNQVDMETPGIYKLCLPCEEEDSGESDAKARPF